MRGKDSNGYVRRELNAREVAELFERLGVKLSLMTAYNLETNRKIEHMHGTIVKAIVSVENGGRQCGSMNNILCCRTLCVRVKAYTHSECVCERGTNKFVYYSNGSNNHN